MLGQRIRPIDLAALAVSFIGVLVISTRGEILSLRFANGPGALLAVGSSVIWALYWLRNVRDRRGAVEKLSTNFLFGTVYIFVLLLILGRWPAVDGAALAGSIYIGAIEMAVAFLLWLGALSLSESSAKVSNLVFLAPFLSLVFIHHFVGESILPSSVVGLAIIVFGIWLQKR